MGLTKGLLAFGLVGLSCAGFGQATVKIGSLYFVNYRGVAGTPEVGDPSLGVGTSFTVVGTPTSSYTITFKYANEVSTWSNYKLSPGNWWLWAGFSAMLAGPVPCSITLTNKDGTASLSANLAMAYPAHAIDFMDAKTMNATQASSETFASNSGTVNTFAWLYGEPQLTSSQGPIVSSSPPAGATQVVTQPLGLSDQQVKWQNLNTATQTTVSDKWAFSAVMHDARVNTPIMRTVPWAAISLAQPSAVSIWQQSEAICPTSATEISDIVTKALPTNYRTTMTPWDAANAVFRQVAKSLTYDANIPTQPLHAYDIGEGQCGDYSYLLVAALRKIGFAARICSGWLTGTNDTHIWTEFYMPGVGWAPADATFSNGYDPTGSYAYFFGTMPDLNERAAVSLGGNQNWALAGFAISFLQGPWSYWTGNASYKTSSNTMTLLTPSALEVEPSEPLLAQKQTMYGTVELQNPAPAAGVTIGLKSNSSSVQVPTSVTIYGGGTTATFPISAGAVSTDTPVEITATDGSLSASAGITVKKETVTVSVGPKWVLGSNPTATFTLNEPAPVATTITVSSNVAGWLPSTITIPEGSSSASFTAPLPVNAGAVGLTVTGTLSGQSDSDSLLAAAKPVGVFAALAPVVGGATVTLTVRLASVAPTAGVTVNLSTQPSGFKLSQGSIMIPAGKASGTVTLTTPKVASSTSCVVSLSSSIGSAQATVTVVP